MKKVLAGTGFCRAFTGRGLGGISRADGDRLIRLGQKSKKRPETEEGQGIPLADDE